MEHEFPTIPKEYGEYEVPSRSLYQRRGALPPAPTVSLPTQPAYTTPIRRYPSTYLTRTGSLSPVRTLSPTRFLSTATHRRSEPYSPKQTRHSEKFEEIAHSQAQTQTYQPSGRVSRLSYY